MPSKTASAALVSGLGIIILWSGITNTGILITLRSIVQGTQPVAGLPQNGGVQPSGSTTTSSFTSGVGGSGNGDSIAAAALQMDGCPYVWGGTEPPPAFGGNGKGVDCYGMNTWVLRNKLGYNLYPGNGHPGYLEYMAWSGAQKVSSPIAGDLIIWPTHCGIAVNSTQMISAENPENGTRVDTFQNGGPLAPEPMTILRVIPQTGAVNA